MRRVWILDTNTRPGLPGLPLGHRDCFYLGLNAFILGTDGGKTNTPSPQLKIENISIWNWISEIVYLEQKTPPQILHTSKIAQTNLKTTISNYLVLYLLSAGARTLSRFYFHIKLFSNVFTEQSLLLKFAAPAWCWAALGWNIVIVSTRSIILSICHQPAAVLSNFDIDEHNINIIHS